MKRLAILLLCVAACADTSLTELLVVVDSDITELDRVTFDVVSPDGTPLSESAAVEQWPMSLALVHRGGALGPLSITVTGSMDGETVVQRRARVDFVEGQVRVLRMDLERACIPVAPICDDEETCQAGGCRSVEVAEEELRDWTGELRGLDAGNDGAVDSGDAGTGADGAVEVGPDGGGDSCVVTAEVCNALDDDCDGSTDEDFRLETDMLNCGMCGRACPVDPANASAACVEGECTLTCDDDYDDCDELLGTGCEASLSNPDTCGSCELPCGDATPICDAGVCEAACGGAVCGGVCVDLGTSSAHCGACDRPCVPPPATVPVCAGGACSFRCDVGRYNCDGLMENGCESRRRELEHCGECGTRCRFTSGVASCATGTCELVGCQPGRGDCDVDESNGCETNVESHIQHCGGCDRACPHDEANSTATCTAGSCGLICDPGMRDCDGIAANGCEASLGSNTDCGSCGMRCEGATPVCEGNPSMGWRCVSDCAMTVCGGDCVDVSRSTAHCGACGRACVSPANGMPLCTAGECAVVCDAGFANCNGSYLDGCEVPLGTVSACNSCAPCPAPPNATASCVDAVCGLGSCSSGYRDCNGSPGDGCETSITTTTDCGSCGRVCGPVPHVAERSCTAASCTIAACDAGWVDCDGDYDSGCEVNLLTDRSNCGRCGMRCTGGGMNKCCDGVCGSC